MPLNPPAQELLVAWRKEMPHETLVFPSRADFVSAHHGNASARKPVWPMSGSTIYATATPRCW